MLRLCLLCCYCCASDVEGDCEWGFLTEGCDGGFEGEALGGAFGVVFLHTLTVSMQCSGGWLTFTSLSTLGTLNAAIVAIVAARFGIVEVAVRCKADRRRMAEDMVAAGYL